MVSFPFAFPTFVYIELSEQMRNVIESMLEKYDPIEFA